MTREAPRTPKSAWFPFTIALLFLLASTGTSARAQDWANDHWVATWSASMQPEFRFPGAPPTTIRFENQTLRMIVRTSIGGHRVRVRLSNAYGTTPLQIGAAHIAIRAMAGAIVPASDRALTFSGRSSVTIPPGAVVLSDEVRLDVPKLGDLAISVYVPDKSGPPTWHGTGLHPTYIGTGDLTGKEDIPDVAKQVSWFWIERVEVTAPPPTQALVAFGDSITDGARSSEDQDHSWPSQLADRLLAQPGDKWAVVDAGISGNRILHDLIGTNALARFDNDVLMQPGVRDVIILEGINDIGFSAMKGQADQAVSADDLIAGLRQLVERAHVRGVKVFGGTLTPFDGAMYFSADGEMKRETINNWIRTSGVFDGVVDFDKAVRDPQQPTKIQAAYDSGDHLHPNDAGYKAMAEAVDLSLFSSKGKGEKHSRQ